MRLDRSGWVVGFMALALVLGGCPSDGDEGASGSGGSTDGPSAAELDACTLLTPTVIEGLTGYAVTATPSSPGPGGCLFESADGELGVLVSIGADAGADSDAFLGIHREDGGNGVELKINDDYGEIVGLVYPDGSAVSLSISGTARSSSTDDPASPILDEFNTGDGAVLSTEEIHAMLIDAIRSVVE